MEKPLPNLPPPPPASASTTPARARRPSQDLTLTIEARAHIHRFVTRVVEDESDIRDRDGWAERIEASLDELGRGLARGGWLAGLRHARGVRRKHHEEEEKRRIEEQVRKEKEEEERARNKTTRGRPSRLKELVVEEQDEDEEEPTEEERNAALDKLREIASKPPPPTPRPGLKHLLLSVSGPPPSEPTEDMGFRLVRASPNCSFRVDEFWLPRTVISVDDTEPVVLYGLDEWDACLLSTDDPLQIVGGTFVLKGVPSFSQYIALTRILRVTVYAYLSLLLEQALFSNSRVEMHYPKPTMPHLPSFPTTAERTPTSDIRDKHKRDSGSGLWSFLSKKTEEMLHKASSPIGRRGSVDAALGQRFPRHTSLPHGPEGGFLARRLSLLSSVSSQAHQDSSEVQSVPPYAITVRRVDSWKDLMSTSPGVAFPPPRFLQAIANQETKDPTRRLVGDERAAVTSLLGWHGRESSGRGMVGVDGFVRHQGLTILYSEHVPSLANSLLSPPPTPSKTDTDTSSAETHFPLRVACAAHRRTWLHFRYYRRGRHWDESIGEKIIRWCTTADDPCIHPDCHFTRAEHDMRWIHAGVRLIATLSPPLSSEAATSDEKVRMWHTCAVCGKESPKQVMHDGSFMLSFAKYLELLIYSPAVHSLDPALCEHTMLSKKPWRETDLPMPPQRFNIIRRFSYKGYTVTYTLSEVKDVLEVRVPRLQILRRKEKKSSDPAAEHKGAGAPGDSHRALRREIMKWWQGIAERMDQLEDKFITDHPSAFHKSLPRLPSEDMYEEDTVSTPVGNSHPLPPPSTPSTPKATPDGSAFPFNTTTHSSVLSSTTPTATPGAGASSALDACSVTDTASTKTNEDGDSLELLSSLRFKFQQAEQDLYAELSHTSERNLNEVRRLFLTAAKGATRRLDAWEKKHLNEPVSTDVPFAPEPEWWESGCHAVPGGSVIVRENDWGSIIAFTLSTSDYQRELAAMTAGSIRSPAPSGLPSTPAAGARPSFFRASESFRRLMSGESAPIQPDPDHDDAGWHEPETYSAVISRKEHPRDPVSLASLRDVLRQKAGSLDSGSPSMLLTPAGLAGARLAGTETPRGSVRAKAAVEISTAAAGGHVSGMPEPAEAAGKILHDLEAVAKANSSRSSLPSVGAFEAHIHRPKASSILGSDGSTVQENVSRSTTPPPPVPPKEGGADVESSSTHGSTESQPPPTPVKTTSMFSTGFSSLSSAVGYVLKRGDGVRPGVGPQHHALLSVATDAPTVDERPHIKYDWTIGKRLRFSCTVYYARQFDQLRRRCGVEDVFMQSMARSENWAAEGGKSKSNFWKTTDNRFIIKTLVNAWNVADLQVLIDLGPSYFKYIDTTATRPTVLAKLLGFYTVEIRNLETGTTQSKADLLVMENLFYDKKISKTFDLKGIQGRKVKASAGVNTKTLFDGEWIEGQQRALTLVQAHSKVVLQEAIKADCEFLAKSNIMDYSLLLGIDEENKDIVCGLVDTIGSYTFAKTLEYKAKQGLNSGKEVTVVPPNEYQDRFVTSMDDYFLACPDKWSRPLDNVSIPSDYRELPSVL
ncbi:uncharacterized protein BXZ73DRAFT_92596 [Epithele typhae]|uniref:uncharacterized protein n=1 Tax=Epithele typhae TaxID=378194 RepID=UPI002008CB96|nr:uncharacterized protein BXZ73DRAFT_92596 [Epithele typhae]KAH9915577.1 hypothetical protein BXZ73DRAFT_92596 [Epithele typhae]